MINNYFMKLSYQLSIDLERFKTEKSKN